MQVASGGWRDRSQIHGLAHRLSCAVATRIARSISSQKHGLLPGKPYPISLASSVNQARFALGRAPGRKQVPGGLKIALLYLSKGLLTYGIIVIGFAAAAPFQDEGVQCLECTLHILVEYLPGWRACLIVRGRTLRLSSRPIDFT